MHDRSNVHREFIISKSLTEIRYTLRQTAFRRLFRRPASAVGTTVIGALAATAVSAFLSTGVDAQAISPSIAPSKVQVNRVLRQGQDISLPSLSVGMPGEKPATIEINVILVGDQRELTPDNSWFDFNPQRFDTAPGKNAVVEVRMSVPREAQPGDYKALLQARAVRNPATLAGGGVGISGAVASTLTFSVVNVDFKPWDPAVDFFRERAPFSYVGLGLLVGSLGIYFLQARYALDFGIRLRKKQ
jgi:hypothetical protein